MQCWFLYKKFETKGQKCPVSQITDRFAFCETRRRTLPWVPKVFFLVGALSTWLKCTWVKWKSTFSKNIRCLARDQNLSSTPEQTEIFLIYMSIISASCCIYEKRWESEETSCIYVSGFEELVSQNTYFGICIFCPSAVLILVLGLSHGGNGLLWHWIYSFQVRFIHFVSFRKIQK